MITKKTYRPSLKSAVLFLVFNRPNTTAQVFDAIRRARVPRLYVAGDGARHNHSGEAKKCEQVRRIATAVDWPCEVKTLFRDKNLGCKIAVSEALSWFFRNENQGIILEDDCLPHSDFFIFCETMLEKFQNTESIFAITGDNFQNGQKRGSGSYYFSKYNHCWGWATWRRAWLKYQGNIPFWPAWKHSSEWRAICSDNVERRYWEKIFDQVNSNKIDTTWDYPWTASVWRHGGLTVTPNVNLVSNIGFGKGATHTTEAVAHIANLPTQSLSQIIHPKLVARDDAADQYVFDHHFGGRHLRWPYNWIRIPFRAIRWLIRRAKVINS